MATKVAVMADFRERLHQLRPAALVTTLELTKQLRYSASRLPNHSSFPNMLFRLVQRRVVWMADESFKLVLGCADALKPFAKFVIVVQTSFGLVRDCVFHCSTSLSLLLAPNGVYSLGEGRLRKSAKTCFFRK
jgi:hypothetical protein